MNKEKKINNLLKSKKLSITKPRIQVLTILDKSNSPMNVDDIINQTNGQIAISSAYRVIADLMDVNLVNTFQSPDNKLLVELVHDDTAHHHHLYCNSCNKAIDIELDKNLEKNINQLIHKISKKNKITITDHSFDLFGICDNTNHKS